MYPGTYSDWGILSGTCSEAYHGTYSDWSHSGIYYEAYPGTYSEHTPELTLNLL